VTDLAGFAKACRSMAADAPKLERRATNAAALEVKGVLLAEMRRAAPNLRLNVGKRGKKIGVSYQPGASSGTAVIRATGPVQLIESATKPHRIPRERRRGRRVVVIPGLGVRAWANHPGTRGKHPWSKGVALAVPKVPKIVDVELNRTLGKHFGG
jgi:hypothetical protein